MCCCMPHLCKQVIHKFDWLGPSAAFQEVNTSTITTWKFLFCFDSLRDRITDRGSRLPEYILMLKKVGIKHNTKEHSSVHIIMLQTLI